MKKTFFLFSLSVSLLAHTQDKSKQYDIAKESLEKVIQHLMSQNYEKVHTLFDSRMGEMLTVEKMQKTFEGFVKQYGAIQKGLEFSQENKAEKTYFKQGIQLEKNTFDLVISLNEENQLSSLNLKPYNQVYKWSLPNYAKTENTIEESLELGDSLKLLARYTNSIPTSNVIVVFVHGSGPNDMDESLGPNKFFKDLAYGFAANGIGNIRYNKRSYDYPSKMARSIHTININDIVVDDAVSAIKTARTKGAEKVILLGHSLGGHMTARIASLVEVDGVIVMAGNVSPIEDLLVPQYEHIMKNDSNSKINDFQLNMIKAQTKRVQDKKYDKNTAIMLLPLGLPASFWLSLKEYNPAKLAKKQDFPYLILNGDRDYQVTPNEAKKWKNGSKHKKSKTIIYPKLNHLFFAGEGVCIPSEYEREAHVEEQVIKDMANWIKAL